MIRFNIIRNRDTVLPLFLSKTQKHLANQIKNGINSCPFKETQLLQLEIYDRPISGFLAKFFELPKNFVKPKMKALLTRAFYDGEKLSAKKYYFNDTFTLEQIKALKEGKDLAQDKNSFMYRLLDNINKAISE